MAGIPDNIKVDTRIQVGDDRATIRYVGQVAGSTGIWLGVEWDNNTRGKHDGSRNGHSYFTCRSDTSGSFIRYNAKLVMTGQTFLEALSAKYHGEEQTDSTTGHDPKQDAETLYLGGNKNIEVERVGFEKIQRKQRELSALKVVGLADMKIVSAGEDQAIANASLSMEDVDLSKNLINDWASVASITSQLSRLNTLRLNHIRLLPPNMEQLTSTPSSPFQHLRTLVLCNTHTTWEIILQLEPLLLQLEDLQLSSNGIKTIDRAPTHFQQLKCINLEDNCLDDWKEIGKLGALPKLETLFLNGNKIDSIDLTPNAFTQLAVLRIDRNQLHQWESFDALDRLPSLVKLRCHENPLFQGLHKEEAAAQLVGRIHGLTTLNGNDLTGRERIDLERFYLKLCTRDGTSLESIAMKHARFSDLCRVHGEPDLQLGKNSTTNTSALNQRLMNITLSYLHLDSEQALVQHHKDGTLPLPIKSVEKRVLATMTVRSLRTLIQKLFAIPTSRQHLFLLQQQQQQQDPSKIAEQEEPSSMLMDMTDDLRDLKFYSLAHGDQIIILDY